MIAKVLNEQVNDFYRSKIKTWPARSNQASGLAWPIRHLVLKRIGWEFAQPVSASTQRRFQRGIETEKYVLNELLPNLPAVTVRGTGLPVEHKPAEIAGRIDAEIAVNGQVLPLEVKSLQYFSRYLSAHDFRGSLFTENYYHQLNTYLFCSNRELGLFLLIDPTSYDTRFLEMPLDLEAAEATLQKCEAVNKIVHEFDGRSFAAEDVEYLPDCDECSNYCQFQALCGRAEKATEALDNLDLDHIDALAARRIELEPLAKEFDAVKDELKTLTAGHVSVTTPNYLITGGEVNFTTYKVPKDVKEQYAEKSSYWRVKKVLALSNGRDE